MEVIIKKNEIENLEHKFINKDKFKILNENQTMRDFLRNVIELLRISIILIILYRNGKMDLKDDKLKKQFINLIDDSLIDKEKEKVLKKFLDKNDKYINYYRK